MSLHHYEQNEVTTLLSGILYVYNGSGSLVSDAGRGIARIGKAVECDETIWI